MPFAIFLDKTVIRIIDSTARNEPIQYNPSQTKYYIKEGKFIFFDGIEEQDFNNHGYQDFTDREGNSFISEDAFVDYLDGFICSSSTLSRPSPMTDVDYTGRVSMNSVFGDRYTGERRAVAAAQFQYGFPAGNATAEIENGGTIVVEDAVLNVGTGIDPAGRARIANKKAIRYIPGYESYIFFTAIFTQGVPDSYQRGGLFDDQNGYFVGFEGIDFKCTRRRNGVDYSYTVNIADVFGYDYDFDPTMGNIYKISFGYLGFANVSFEILRPDGRWEIIYRIEYPNSSTVVHITNTHLPPAMEVANTGNTSVLTVGTGSFSAGLVGDTNEDPTARQFSFSGNNIDILPTYQLIFIFRNKDVFNLIKNYIEARLLLLNPATDISKNSVWEFRKNMTISNTPTWTDINASDSIIEYSSDAVVVADSGELSFSWVMGKTQTIFENLLDLDINIEPNDTMALIVKSPIGTNGTIDISMTWRELF